MANEKIRIAAKKAKIPLWQIAERAFDGMADSAFSRKLRHQLSAEDEARAMAAIAEIQEEAKTNEQR